MSTKGARDYRPMWHYTPPKMWINDPNGLAFDGERYHLFAQHYPEDTRHGPMHWLHATSTDLVNWDQLGIAIYPDELGVIFSGSAILDIGNTSGFGEGKDPLIAMFTHHGESEQQSIAYSNDGVTFVKYENNPVIKNLDMPNFRDPKVFRNHVLNCWSCVVAAGDRCMFYRSADFLTWEKTGEFGATENKMDGIFECPDVFPLKGPKGDTVWVLVASMTGPRETGGSCTQYFLGEFDGYTFRDTKPFEVPELIDYGYDNYAAVTFSGAEGALLLGWGHSWTYAADVPTGDYCGCMTLARKQTLIETKKGLRMASQPVLPALPQATACRDKLESELFVLDIEADGAFEVCLKNGKDECFRFGLNGENRFFTDRSQSGEMDFNDWYKTPVYQFTERERVMEGPVKMRLIFDRSIAELFADCGTYVNTSVIFPTAPYDAMEIQGAKAEIREI